MIAPLLRLASAGPTRAAVNASFAAWSRRRVGHLAAADPAEIQRRTLLRLVRAAESTRFGRDHGFSRIKTIEDFRRSVPLRTYENLWCEYLRDAYPSFADLSWTGRTPYLALTSGTTQGATKYIPVSREMLASNFKASRTMLAYHYASRPRSRLFQGKIFFLGGSTDLESVAPGVLQGDLSGIVAREVPAISRPYTFPPLELALETDWDRKLTRLAERSAREPITLVGGVPSWLLVLFERLKQVTGKATMAEVWPGLEVVVHGGVKFDPYKKAFAEALPGVALQDAYTCSEGFIGFGDPAEPSLLRPLFDHGLFLEFVPADELDSDRPTRHGLGDFELGVNYAVVVSTCAGLWAHVIGDTVRFESRDPILMTFTGRTKYTLSAFGEHLISEEVEAAIAEAAEDSGAIVGDWHVGPVFEGPLGHHLFLVEFLRQPAELDPDRFRTRLDDSLKRRNADYQAHRAEGVGLPLPTLLTVQGGGMAAWMRSKGKLGGQHKMPRMDGTGKLTEEIQAFLSDHEFLAL